MGIRFLDDRRLLVGGEKGLKGIDVLGNGILLNLVENDYTVRSISTIKNSGERLDFMSALDLGWGEKYAHYGKYTASKIYTATNWGVTFVDNKVQNFPGRFFMRYISWDLYNPDKFEVIARGNPSTGKHQLFLACGADGQCSSDVSSENNAYSISRHNLAGNAITYIADAENSKLLRIESDLSRPSGVSRTNDTGGAIEVKSDGFGAGAFLVSINKARICHFKLADKLPIIPDYKDCFDVSSFGKPRSIDITKKILYR